MAKHAIFRGETLISVRNRPCCKAFWGPKRHPFLRQNIKSGPFCKAKLSRTHPLKWHTHSIPGIGRIPPGRSRETNTVTALKSNRIFIRNKSYAFVIKNALCSIQKCNTVSSTVTIKRLGQPMYRHIFKFYERRFFIMYITIYEQKVMSTFLVNNFVRC